MQPHEVGEPSREAGPVRGIQGRKQKKKGRVPFCQELSLREPAKPKYLGGCRTLGPLEGPVRNVETPNLKPPSAVSMDVFIQRHTFREVSIRVRRSHIAVRRHHTSCHSEAKRGICFLIRRRGRRSRETTPQKRAFMSNADGGWRTLNAQDGFGWPTLCEFAFGKGWGCCW